MKYLKYAGFEPFPLSLPLNWATDPYKNLNWRHNLCSLRWLGSFSDEFKIDIIKDFYSFHVVKGKKNPLFSERKGDHTMSIRLKVLVDFYLNSIEKLTVYDAKVLKNLIFADIKNLLLEDNYNAGHNHGLMLDLSLLYCASNFKESGDFFDVEMVFDRASKTLSQMFNDYGFTKEHSIVCQPLNAALANELFDYAVYFKQSELIGFIQKINNATNKLLEMARLSDGHYFTVGDSFRKIDPSLIENSIANSNNKKQK
ncbi:MAG: hypothetical protein MZV65_38790 [Chromatiales bacterium]|nr:hypothetical protein [Chromatiales bacterium]